MISVQPVHIDLLTRIMEAFGHLGVVTTLDRHEGLVMIRGTADTVPDILEILASLPFELTILPQE